jgi:hypothetical protein
LASDATENLEERTTAATHEGRDAPSHGGAAIVAYEPAPPAAQKRQFRLVAAAKRYGYTVALIAVAILYCLWPNDFAPDRKWYGGIDDVVFFVLLAFLARQVFKRSPALLELPNAILRAAGRKSGRHR